MILEKIAFLMEHMYRHMAFQSNRIERLEEQLNHVANTVADPTGEITFGGVAKIGPEQVRKAFEGLQHVRVEEVELGFRFGQHLYMSIKPDLHKRIKDALEDAPLKYLTDAFESYKKLNDVVLEAEKVIRELHEKSHRVNGEIEINVQAVINQKFEEQQKRLDKTFAQAEEDRKMIAAAMERLDVQMEKAKAIQAQANNIVTASKPASRGFGLVKGGG